MKNFDDKDLLRLLALHGVCRDSDAQQKASMSDDKRLAYELSDLVGELVLEYTEEYYGESNLYSLAVAERIMNKGWTKPVHCCNCGFFMEYTEEQKQKTTCKGAVGDCYIRRMHSDDEEFYSRKANDYCSDGKVREDA